MDEPAAKSTRERSPNYPAFSLEASIQFAKMLYGVEKRSTVPLELVAKALGSLSLSGPARTKIAAMRQYGLVEDVGRGKVKISDRALAILQKPTPEKYREAIQAAALEPTLFNDLREKHPEASDGALRYYLQTELKFIEDGANRVIKAYKDTLAFAEITGESYNDGNSDEDGDGTQDPLEDAQKLNEQALEKLSSLRGKSTPRGSGHIGASNVAYTWPLPDGIDAQVAFSGSKPTRRAVQRLIDYLTFFKDDLPDADALNSDGENE